MTAFQRPFASRRSIGAAALAAALVGPWRRGAGRARMPSPSHCRATFRGSTRARTPPRSASTTASTCSTALTELQRDGQMNPRLAESWTYSPDLTEWTFKLRQGVKFHDGSPFTADDVVFTIKRIKADATTPVRTFIRLVTTVEKVDDHTVRFKLIQPYGIFHRQISYVNIMSKTYFDKVGDEGYATKPVGTGPYKLVRWVKDDRMVLEANPDYWRGAPAIKRATFRPIPAEASRASALLSGEVDLVPALPPSLIESTEIGPRRWRSTRRRASA